MLSIIINCYLYNTLKIQIVVDVRTITKGKLFGLNPGIGLTAWTPWSKMQFSSPVLLLTMKRPFYLRVFVGGHAARYFSCQSQIISITEFSTKKHLVVLACIVPVFRLPISRPELVPRQTLIISWCDKIVNMRSVKGKEVEHSYITLSFGKSCIKSMRSAKQPANTY